MPASVTGSNCIHIGDVLLAVLDTMKRIPVLSFLDIRSPISSFVAGVANNGALARHDDVGRLSFFLKKNEL